MPVMIGMMGLGIDVGIMYAVKARIQMACDGGAVAALRSLSLAQTTTSPNHGRDQHRDPMVQRQFRR